MKIGQYTVIDGEFRHRYLVRRIMKKTAIVSILDDYKGSEWAKTHYRYDLNLLSEQIKNAEYVPFNT